ncbi:MAG: hypothetical protein JRI23_33655 [Deltaproteobacteria bacterium]|jgi:hypothetical protein|nr:hypothetical protein [Deltaproteobacteria bacterium]MBW2537228.1 hypothetical protein [Deltaproteobacteria bacterium]
MLCLFEVFVVPGPRATDPLLSEEIMEHTQAQVMTPEQAEAVGFHGIPEDPEGRKRVFIAVSPRDARLVHTRLEASAAVGAFKMHEVET